SLSFRDRKIFDNISVTIQQKQRIGLVGQNGSGKSTLLRVITGNQSPDSGVVAINKNKKIAYLPQEVVLSSDKSILAETLSVFEQITVLEREGKELEEQLKKEQNEKILERYLLIQEQLADFNIGAATAEAKKILMGLGFSLEQLEAAVSSLSVGWKMRIVLAKLLLQKADFYLFDEPTNHLDITAMEWFLQFLKQASFGFILICHDRYFLNMLCEYILELEMGYSSLYIGNYDTYEIKKEHDLKLREAAYHTQQKEIKRKEETINRFRASANKAKMAQSMLKSLEKMERISLPPSLKTIHFTFPPIKRSGRIVLNIENVAHQFGEKQIFFNVSFSVERGEKVALIAPNGVGKTTLFNVIVGKLSVQKGTINFGHNITHALFDQDQNAALDLNASIFDNIVHQTSGVSEQTIRTFLGSFLFSNDDINKKIKVLSGGEKNRVGMIRVLLQQANLLFLDEPTNHLDISSKELLLKALQEYQGTVLFVSHDRDFVNKLATRIIELTPNGVINYEGDYEGYLYYKKQISQQQKNETFSREKKIVIKKENQKELERLQKESKRLEKEITTLEQKIIEVEYCFAHLTYGSQGYTQLEQQLITLQQKKEELLKLWEEVQEKVEK
ncbi:MAG: ATP-binding cassette domain-containing protein, partial [Candidatus Babeliales bacterium]